MRICPNISIFAALKTVGAGSSAGIYRGRGEDNHF